MKLYDYLIVGAGIVGLSIAKELKFRNPGASILVLEKEIVVGLHSSGRNSGVLHSGIYYPSESIKARVCRQGSIEMADYCLDRGLPLNRIGKVLVPVNCEDSSQLDLLQVRAEENGVAVERLDQKSLALIEPEARSATGEALFVPSTAVVDPVTVMRSILDDCITAGIKIQYSSLIDSADEKSKRVFLLDGSIIGYGHLINAAGLHADKLAHTFGVGFKYTLLPFKGIYWKLSPDSGLKINHLIYPVPDLRVPFLGVHTTTSTDGIIYLGPTAVPAFGRENYSGLQDVSFSEAVRISTILMTQIISGKGGFRRLAWQEGARYFKPWFVEAARQIIPRLKSHDLLPCTKVGIRAQMFDRQTKKLVNDFLVEKGHSSTHILNAISPAWTSAFSFSKYVCDEFL